MNRNAKRREAMKGENQGGEGQAEAGFSMYVVKNGSSFMGACSFLTTKNLIFNNADPG